MTLKYNRYDYILIVLLLKNLLRFNMYYEVSISK